MKRSRAFTLSQYDIKRLARVKEILEARFDESLTLKLLSSETGIHKSKLTYGFKKQTGISVHQYLTKVRIEVAKRYLIEGELPTKAIASRCGYRNVKSFITVFKKYTGQTVMQFIKGATR